MGRDGRRLLQGYTLAVVSSGRRKVLNDGVRLVDQEAFDRVTELVSCMLRSGYSRSIFEHVSVSDSYAVGLLVGGATTVSTTQI